MYFIMLAATIACIALLLQRLKGNRGWRSSFRHGIGGAFLFTGVDHFASFDTRYIPMIPPYLELWAVELVLLSGLLEILGAIGLLLPARAWSRLGLPPLRATAGVGLVMLLSVMVVANAHMAELGLQTEGLAAGPNYLAIRPLLQPLIILWVLIAAELYSPPRFFSGSEGVQERGTI